MRSLLLLLARALHHLLLAHRPLFVLPLALREGGRLPLMVRGEGGHVLLPPLLALFSHALVRLLPLPTDLLSPRLQRCGPLVVAARDTLLPTGPLVLAFLHDLCHPARAHTR